MRSRTVIQYEGEYLGPVDWDYDFRQHFNNRCCSEERKDAACRDAIDLLSIISESPDKYWFVDSCGFRRTIYQVGMYDGWPFWTLEQRKARQGGKSER